MKKDKIKSKLKKVDKNKNIYTYVLFYKKGNKTLGELIFTSKGEDCDFCCRLEKKEYYEQVFFDIFLTVIHKLFKLGYRGVNITPDNEVELETIISFGFTKREDGTYYLESRNNYRVKVTKENEKDFQALYTNMINDERLLRMKNISQHRGSNTYEHSLRVTRLAYRISKGLRIKADYYSLIRASLLHDYFLYDWRVDREKLHGHGHNHPYIAVVNADKDFKLNYLEKLIIIDHMWPINITSFPKSWEAKVVSYADKVVSMFEASTQKWFKRKLRKKTIEKLKTL